MSFMILFRAVAALLLGACHAQAKAVFAHFMVSNTANYTLGDWTTDITLAQAAHIDAFVLNTAYNQGDEPHYDLAFQAAADRGFKLLFSFDYAGNGAWPKESVLQVLNKYTSHGSYYLHNGQPFVSTFEGPDSASDWIDIKARTGCFFVPDWSSLGAKAALEQANGVADGLFSWAAWPWGSQDMDTFVDASYQLYLDGKPYMMPVSPWFYTNLPGYDKNWLWRGDDLWNDRWLQVLYLQPEWVQIISWNDYGESHYIGPIRSNALGAMNVGRAPLDYVSGMPHDGWRLLLPFLIDMYVKNTTTIEQEALVVWYRTQPAAACDSGGTSGNTASQLQVEFPPAQVVQDKIFFSAILASAPDSEVSVSIGGVSVPAKFTMLPDGRNGIGRYHGSVSFGGHLGAVTVTVSRNGSPVMTVAGVPITSKCDNGLANWNAWVGSEQGSRVSATPQSMDELLCTGGTSIPSFSGLCEFACHYGYCPLGACVCTSMGSQVTKPAPQNIPGYPAAGTNENYSGLCGFNCNLGYCPEGACTTVPAPLTTPTVSPFSPPACVSGEGPDPFPGLCSFACGFGFCPMNVCKCTGQGALVQPPPITHAGAATAASNGYEDHGLCSFACQRGYCPFPCVQSEKVGSGPPVFIDTMIWDTPTPTVSCVPPCVVVLPPITLPTPTTINFPPVVTTLTEKWNERSSTTTVLTFTFPPIVTTEIPVFNINITQTGVNGVTYTVTPSILPSTSTTIRPPDGSSSATPVVVWLTSTPQGPSTYPPLTNVPTKVVVSSATPAGPSCTKPGGCGGKQCTINCNSCGVLGCGGICLGCGLGICIGCGPGGVGGGGASSDSCVGSGCKSECASPTTATVCTKLVSSTAVQTAPTTSWSTTTRTYCTPKVGCDATGTTTTTTVTESHEPDPTLDAEPIVDEWDENDSNDDAFFASVESDYSSFAAMMDAPAPTTTSSTTSPAPTSNLTPLTRGPVNCFNQADFPGHGDIQSGDQDTFSVDFSSLGDNTIGPGDAPIRLRRTDSHGINYDYRVQWVAGCVTTVERQSFRFPLGMSQSLITAYLLVREDYTKCNNGGIGGSCQVGCLLYTFEGGRGDQSFRVAAVPSQYPSGNHSHYVAGVDGGIVVDDLL